MPNRLRVITMSLGIFLALLAFYFVPISLAAPMDPSDSGIESSPGAKRGTLAPTALRAISIPFGVESILTLSEDRLRIQIVGHADCPDEADTFAVHVLATQDGPEVYGESDFTAPMPCEEQEQPWTTEVEAQPAASFSEGPAWVCVTALFFDPASETGVFRWCYKDVTLEIAQAPGSASFLPVVVRTIRNMLANLPRVLDGTQ